MMAAIPEKRAAAHHSAGASRKSAMVSREGLGRSKSTDATAELQAVIRKAPYLRTRDVPRTV